MDMGKWMLNFDSRCFFFLASVCGMLIWSRAENAASAWIGFRENYCRRDCVLICQWSELRIFLQDSTR